MARRPLIIIWFPATQRKHPHFPRNAWLGTWLKSRGRMGGTHCNSKEDRHEAQSTRHHCSRSADRVRRRVGADPSARAEAERKGADTPTEGRRAAKPKRQA